MKRGVANRLRELRQDYNLTQELLARDLDVSRHTILAIEVGRYVPSIELALTIAAYFDEPLETIFWLAPPPDAALRGGARRHRSAGETSLDREHIHGEHVLPGRE